MMRRFLFILAMSAASLKGEDSPLGSLPKLRVINLGPPKMSIGLHGGASLALGETSKYNSSGAAGGFDLISVASPELSLDYFIDYASMSYKDSAASQPMSTFGLGFRFAYTLFDVERVRPFLRMGLGYYFATRASAELKGYDLLGQPILALKYRSTSGMGVTGGLGAGYAVTDDFEAQFTLDVTSISLAGGTGDTFMYATPSLGFAFTF